VHTDLSSDGVMVSDFAEGVSCQDVLDAVEAKDPVALAELAEMGIEPKRVAWNVQMLAFWGQHEAPIFHADPHPGNIIVQPGNRVVMIDFGACGMTNELVAMLGRRVAVRLKRMDPAGAADAAVIQSQPYPRMALHAYMDAAHRTFLKWFQGGQDPEAAWWERSTATVWLSFVDIAREHEIPVNLNSLRLIRCTLLYDTMATRLDPEIPLSIFQDYLDESAARMMARNSGQLRQRASRVEGTWAQPPMRTTLDRAVASIRRIDAASMQFRWAMLARHGVGWEVLRALRLGVIVGITFLTSLAVPALAVALALFGDDLSASRFGSGGLLLESPLPWLAAYLGWLVATRMLRNRLERVAPRAA
jgi:predicted unusual protein kinase regulating ubiquinone biosynthesis (AarF/ABC1/UbiB family)